LFEQQVERTPEATAVIFENKQITYRELNSKANQLAHHLIGLGVGADVLVGISVERSIEMVVGLLGVLKAGGAYLPIDPAYPEERRNFMLSDSGVQVLLTQSKLVDMFGSGLKLLCLDQDSACRGNPLRLPSPQTSAGSASFASVSPDNLAYCIYTSGSTGKPKGVLVEHHSLCNLTLAQIRLFNVHSNSKILQFVSFSFDVATGDIFMALCRGATLYLASTDTSLALASLTETLHEQAITHIELPASVLAALPFHDLPALQSLVVGGEACPPELIAQWSKGRELFNAYGPTEATICATMAKLTPTDISSKHVPRYEGTPPIGRPIPNTQIYILDDYLQPVPIGVPGELYIGGAGVARGYLNRPQLTKEKFIPNPYGQGRLYKTGDLCRYLPDTQGAGSGNIEFLGRIDHQVKIRGFRIELGEIEALLSQHPKVLQVVVVVRQEGGPSRPSKRLVAYLVHEEAVSNDELRRHLASQLPAYMLPSAFVRLDTLPLTPNGKVDRRKLPAPHAVPQAHRLESEFVEGARTPTEALLATIWAELLTVEQASPEHCRRISVHDNFFELGGDSILSIQIISRAKQAGLHFTPKQLFQHQTIAELAAVATHRGVRSEAQQTSEQGVVTGSLPLTPIQQWFLAQQWLEPHHFNQSFLLEVKPDLSPILLRQAVAHLLLHHDVLRLRFSIGQPQGIAPTGDGQRWQQSLVAAEHTVPFEVVDLSHRDASQSALSSEEQLTALESKANQLQASLNLSEGPLLRVALFRARGQDKLLIVIHHLAVDGVSWRILLEDLQTAYQQLASGEKIELPAKTTSFKQWATLLNEQGPTVVANELAYWRSVGSTSPLPVDYELGQNNIASAANISCVLEHSETQRLLKEVPAVYNTQINDLLLTALLLAFRAWTGESCLRLDLEGHGREELFEANDALPSDGVDLSRTVGWFTTIFPVLLSVESNILNGIGDPSSLGTCLGEAIKSVKEQLRQIPNRGIGYGILRYLSSAPPQSPPILGGKAAQVSFNYYGQFDQMSKGPLISGFAANSSLEHSPQGTRPYLLEINGVVVDGRLQVDWTYSQNYHRAETIEQLANSFIDALQALIAHCQSPNAGGYTPSDFPEAELSQEELDELLGDL
jgi:amino acid adenylation domain-containing protein/non-ribosomal peptide synthase protein (TIGR01720 family)